MNSYYLTLVLKPDLEEKDRKALLGSICKKVVGTEGKIKKEDLWGVKALTYPIKRNNKGYFAHFELQADPTNIKGLDKAVDLEEDVLRYLLIRR